MVRYAGALIVTIMVLLLGSTRRGQSPVAMVLAGVCVGAVLGGATSALTLTNPDAFDQMRNWDAGSMLGAMTLSAKQIEADVADVLYVQVGDLDRERVMLCDEVMAWRSVLLSALTDD